MSLFLCLFIAISLLILGRFFEASLGFLGTFLGLRLPFLCYFFAIMAIKQASNGKEIASQVACWSQ